MCMRWECLAFLSDFIVYYYSIFIIYRNAFFRFRRLWIEFHHRYGSHGIFNYDSHTSNTQLQYIAIFQRLLLLVYFDIPSTAEVLRAYCRETRIVVFIMTAFDHPHECDLLKYTLPFVYSTDGNATFRWIGINAKDHAIQRLCTNSTNRCIHFEWFTVFSFHTCCASHRYWNPSEKIQKQIAPKRMQNNLDFVYGTESENAQIAIHETRCTMHFDFKFAYEPLISICNSVWRMLLTAEEKNTSSKQTVYISPLVINTTIVLYRYYLLLNNRRSNVDKRGRTQDPISHRHSRVRVEGRHLHHQIDTCDAKWCDSMCVSN